MLIQRLSLLLMWLLLSDAAVGGFSSTHTPTQQLSEGMGVLVGEVLKEGGQGCHLTLLSSSSSPLLTYLVRWCSVSLLPAAVVEVEGVGGVAAGVLRAVWASVKVPCRALLLDITSKGAEDSFRVLEEAGIRVWPDLKVVVVGAGQVGGRAVLHHALRNIAHALYMYTSSDPRPRPRNTDDGTMTAGNTTKAPPSSLQSLLQQGDGRVTVLQRCLYCNEKGEGARLLYSGLLKEVTKEEVRRWALAWSSNDEDHNLQGHVMRVVGLRYDPYSRYDSSPLGPGHPVVPLTSIDFSLLDAVSSALNFTYEARPPKVPMFGLPLGDGNWTGTVGVLQREEADMSLVLSPTSGRLKVIEYSRIYMSESLCILSPRPQALPQYLQLIKPLSGWVWTITAVIIFCWGVSLWVFRRAWQLYEGVGGRVDLPHALLYSWGTLLGDEPAPPPRLTSGRILFGGWLVFALVLSTAYRSSLIAHLTVLSKLPPVNSFEDLLAGNDWTWGMRNATGTMTLYFVTATDPTRKEIRRRMELHGLEEGLTKVLKGGHSVIEDRFIALVTISSRYTYDSGYTPVYFSTTNYPIFAGLAWGFRKGAPFRRAISLLKQRTIEAGLLHYWTDEAVKATTDSMIKDEGGRRALNIDPQESEEKGGTVVLSLQHLQGIFYLLGLGLLLACLAFTHELPTRRRLC